jgi:hypothetical protein
MRINDLINRCDKLNLRTTELNNNGHRICHFSKQNDNIHILHCNIDLEEITSKSPFDFIICGFFENNKFGNWFLFYKLLELCERGEIIYLIIDIENYYIVPEKTSKGYHKTVNTGQWHSVSLIFNPRYNKIYDIFYINAHGKSMCEENIFEKLISNTRIKEYKFPNHINFIFMNIFVEKLKKYFENNYVESKSSIELRYNKTAKHNYYGCNLQNGDYYGVCFIFPLLIYHYFDKYYNKSRFVGDRNTIMIPSVSVMLKNNQVDKFVKSCFLDLTKKFEKVLLFRNNKEIDEFILKKRTILIKKIVSKLLDLISQKHI